MSRLYYSDDARISRRALGDSASVTSSPLVQPIEEAPDEAVMKEDWDFADGPSARH